jgi:hypothetical protein
MALDLSGYLSQEWKDKLRPYLTQYLGEERTNKLIGTPAAELELPAIPKLVNDARSTEVFDQKDEGKKMDAAQEEKYNLAFVQEIYEVTRITQANDNDVSKWMNTMSQGATREGIYRAMVLDDVYAGLENYGEGVSQGAVEFTTYFLERFVSQSINPESISKMNLFNLKRVVAEKALEIVDVFSNADELYRWYGVLSGELAAKHGTIFQNPLRSDKSMMRHYNWAKEVPRQHLKSEVVIKIHAIYNHLK